MPEPLAAVSPASPANPANPARLHDAAIIRALLAHRRGDVHYDCR